MERIRLLFLTAWVTLSLPAWGQNDYKAPPLESSVSISKSKLDYTDVAMKATAGCTDNMQKIRAIYSWICEHIAYDTSLRIRTADACIQTGYGVCQAYCELFYQLAYVVGVKVTIISGLSKNSLGEVNPKGHSWLFAYTTEDRGILLDPTWGAGDVINGQFSWSKNPWLWFNPDPEWFLLSHWTKNVAFQLVEHPMTEQEFRNAMPVNELWLEYGLNARELARKARGGTLQLPKFYSQGEGSFHALDIPLRCSLKMGEFYNFRIRVTPGRTFTIHNNRVRCPQEEWTQENDSTYSVRFMPRDTGLVVVSLRAPSGNGWNGILSYQVEPPTAADRQRVEEAYPLSAPELQQVKGLQAALWDSAGVDARKLLAVVREQHIKQLPTLFGNQGQRLTIVAVPMNHTLTAGEPCTFCFKPRSGIKWALVNNDQWHTEWQIGDDNLHTQTITPAAGTLYLYVQMKEEESYWSCLEYEVK